MGEGEERWGGRAPPSRRIHPEGARKPLCAIRKRSLGACGLDAAPPLETPSVRLENRVQTPKIAVCPRDYTGFRHERYTQRNARLSGRSARAHEAHDPLPVQQSGDLSSRAHIERLGCE